MKECSNSLMRFLKSCYQKMVDYLYENIPAYENERKYQRYKKQRMKPQIKSMEKIEEREMIDFDLIKSAKDTRKFVNYGLDKKPKSVTSPNEKNQNSNDSRVDVLETALKRQNQLNRS